MNIKATGSVGTVVNVRVFSVCHYLTLALSRPSALSILFCGGTINSLIITYIFTSKVVRE